MDNSTSGEDGSAADGDDSETDDEDSSDSNLLSSIADWFSSLIAAIKDLPGAIIDGIVGGIKALFIPSEDFINEKIIVLKNSFGRLGVSAFDMSGIFGSETPLSDIKCVLYGKEVTIVRMDIVNNALLSFKGVIRGFITLLLLSYNYDMFMGLIGQQGMKLGALIKSVGSKEEQ